jgi:hypothetical protein
VIRTRTRSMPCTPSPRRTSGSATAAYSDQKEFPPLARTSTLPLCTPFMTAAPGPGLQNSIDRAIMFPSAP